MSSKYPRSCSDQSTVHGLIVNIANSDDLHSESSLAEWRSHCHEQRIVSRQKSEIFRSTAITGCHGCGLELIDFYNVLHHLERSTPRQTLLFNSPPNSRKFVRLLSALCRQRPFIINLRQPSSPTLYPCPLKKSPSC